MNIQMLLGLLENCKLCVKLWCLHEEQGMELPHVHLVFNLVTLVKQVNGAMECMLEITSLFEEKKQNKRPIHLSVFPPVNALKDTRQVGGWS